MWPGNSLLGLTRECIAPLLVAALAALLAKVRCMRCTAASFRQPAAALKGTLRRNAGALAETHTVLKRQCPLPQHRAHLALQVPWCSRWPHAVRRTLVEQTDQHTRAGAGGGAAGAAAQGAPGAAGAGDPQGDLGQPAGSQCTVEAPRPAPPGSDGLRSVGRRVLLPHPGLQRARPALARTYRPKATGQLFIFMQCIAQGAIDSV